MKDQPTLSIRQPWAWLIVNGHKDIENRSWKTGLRARIYVHASKGMTRDEYEDCADMASEIDPSIKLPAMEELERGGIVGEVDITGCVTESESKWFGGEYGFVLQNAEKIPFIPCKGALSFFRARP